MTDVIVKTPKFNMNQYGDEIYRTLCMRIDEKSRVTKLLLLVQRAYEMGLTEGKKGDNWYNVPEQV